MLELEAEVTKELAAAGKRDPTTTLDEIPEGSVPSEKKKCTQNSTGYRELRRSLTEHA